MKQFLILFTLLSLLFSGLSAQNLVGTEPTLKNALLEEFTGIHCSNCPVAHREAQSILEDNPGRVFLIAIHTTYHADPLPGEPDFRTLFGEAIYSQSGAPGVPMGTVNRHIFSGSNTYLNPSMWRGKCGLIIQDMSPVNIGAISTYNADTRMLTTTVELYYTADAAASSNYINIALIQDSIYGPQTNGNAGNNYLHMHVLRHLLTGQWGDEVTTTTQGTLVTRTYTYEIPEDYNDVPAIVENMRVVAFIAESHQEVYTATQVDAIGEESAAIGSMSTAEPLIKKGSNNSQTTFTLEASSNIEGTTAFEFNMETENAPESWQFSYMINGNEYSGTAMVNLTKDTPKQITVKVTPSVAAGFPDVTLKMKSLSNLAGIEQEVTVSVISGVTDLIVNGTGGEATSTHQGVYTDALVASGITSFAVANANKMTEMVNADAYQDVLNFWLNISWTVPALDDSQAGALKTLMDTGHKVFIAGQNIAWDIMSGESGSHGNPANKEIFTNYLKAIYKNNGSASTSQLHVVSGDPIFGYVERSNFVTNLGSNNYPDEIDAGAGANIIFNYNSPSQHAAIRTETENYRAIYFAIGMEMLENTSVRNQIVRLSHDWLVDGIVSVEYDAAINCLISGQNYPNPASDYTYINVNEAAKGGMIQIYNLNGQLITNQSVGNSAIVRLDLSNLNEGMYIYRIVSGNTTSEARKLTVIR